MGTFGTALSPVSMRYRGLEIGTGTQYRILEARGIWDSAVRDGDRLIPRGDGAHLGKHFALPKEPILTVQIVGPAPSGIPSAELVSLVSAFETAFQRSTDDDYPLEFRYQNEPQQYISARILNRSRPRLWSTELGIVNISVRMKAADPRIYGITSQSQAIPLYVAGGGGLDYAVDFAKEFADVTDADSTVTNSGNSDAYPTLKFYGPTSGTMASVTVQNRSNGDEITITKDVGPGQILTADMKAAVDGSGRTVVDLQGTSVYGSWDLPRSPLRISPGSNTLRFTATGDTTGVSCVVSFRNTSI